MPIFVTQRYSGDMEIAWIGKCSAGHIVRATAAEYYGGWIKCGCGREAIAKGFTGTHSDKKCGGRCRTASSGACSCSCGGENHGIDGVFFA